ncbi:MAG: PTS sugar transporter subunit IIA [Spirochaetota bacterium]
MELKLKDVSRLLDIPEKTILQWVRERKIRAFKLYNQYRFDRDELNEWILKGKVQVSAEALQRVQSAVPVSLVKLVENGGIIYDVEGDSVEAVIRSAVHAIPVSADIDREAVAASLLEREEQMTTGMGEGIALPHPRSPIISDISAESVSICFLRTPVDFNAIDGQPVHTLFIILSANPRRHLDILSKVSYICRKWEFVKMIHDGAAADDIVDCIQRVEHELNSAKKKGSL